MGSVFSVQGVLSRMLPSIEELELRSVGWLEMKDVLREALEASLQVLVEHVTARLDALEARLAVLPE